MRLAALEKCIGFNRSSAFSLPKLLSTVAGLIVLGLLRPSPAEANCVTSGNTITCSATSPNPWTTTVGRGPSTASGTTVTLTPGAQISAGNANAISLGDNATITLQDNTLVKNSATSGSGLWSAGTNTIEFNNFGNLTVAATAAVQAVGTQTNAEAVNLIGQGNTVTNLGLISGLNAAAIWFEDKTIGSPNTVNNFGVIQTGNGSGPSVVGNVIGNQSYGNVNFINQTGAVVNGSLKFAGGNDTLTIFPNSTITGGFDGGGGTNTLTLAGAAGSSDTLPGNISNFQTLTKTGGGTWTLSGTVGSNGGNAPLAVEVQQGTLALTGNNASFRGSVLVDAGGILQARAQSLPPSVTDNGLVLFAQPDNGTYAGVLSGSGAVTKTGAGVLTLSGVNTYQGNTLIQGGTVAIGADSGLGASGGAVTLDGGALELTSSFNLSSSRALTLTANNGAIIVDAGATSTLSQPLTGAGAFTKGGGGTLVVTNTNTYAGSTTIAAGTLQLGDGSSTSGNIPGTGPVTDNGTLTFDWNGPVTFANLITGTGGVTQAGSGTTVLTGNNSYAGPTTVTAGTLYVDGAQTGTGATTVAGGATLGGSGALGGSVTVASGATLNPGDPGSTPGTLAIGGDLSLGTGATLNYRLGVPNVGTSPLNDLINVGGNLTLGGTLNVSLTPGSSSALAPGVYRVINYGGALAGGSLALGTVPGPSNEFFVQTAVPHQVNLVNTEGLTLNWWDGDAGPKNDGTINGGNGAWRTAGPASTSNWTEQTGIVNAPWASGDFAIFSGSPGTVTVDNSQGAVTAAGMQFTTNGYLVTGDTITLSAPSLARQAFIDVGDGSTDGAGSTATISAPITGGALLIKDDLGTLVLTGANSYTDGTEVLGGTLRISSDGNLGAAGSVLIVGNGATLGTTASFATSRPVFIADATVETAAGTSFEIDSGIQPAAASSSLTKAGAGTLVLAGSNGYTGGTAIDAGTLQLGNGGTAGSITGNVADSGTLAFDRSNALTFTGTISGSGAVSQIGTGTTTLTADNTYTGGTTISAGTLQIGNGGTTGSIQGDVADSGTLAFNRSDTASFAGTISGGGAVTQAGGGTTVLTAANTYTGATTVTGGALYVNGDQTAATGATNVAAGTLGGIGTVGGSVTVASGATLAPGDNSPDPGTLTINGSLALAGGSSLAYSFGQANVEGGPFNDLTKINGNLTLAGTLNVTLSPGGSFDPGIYRIMTYAGGLTNNTLALGTMPSGTFFVQTSVANQVNLVNATGLTLNYWDGDIGPKNDSQVNGGSGTWRTAGPSSTFNWTDVNGTVNAPWASGEFAVFEATPGAVTVNADNGQVQAAGMQFASDGYVIQSDVAGDGIQLVGSVATPTTSIIRVGDGAPDGAAFTATITAPLSGTSTLEKTDLGTLVLGGANTYSGGTVIDGGTLQTSTDGNLGAASGGVTIGNGATLGTTASFASGRAVTLDGAATIATATSTRLEIDSAIQEASASSSLTKAGAGTLVLTGTNAYTGGTTINAGTLQLGAGGTGGSILGDVTDNGTLAFDRSDAPTFTGLISGSGAVSQLGTGTTVLTADNTYTGGTVISAGTLQLGAGGTSGAIQGAVTDNGTLAFDRSDTATFPGRISGSGGVAQLGTGTTVLTADNIYTGGTVITTGTLQLGSGETTGSITGNVTDNGTLAFDRSDTVTFTGQIAGSGAVNQLGSGTTVLTADNSYTGGTAISAGTLQLGTGGTTGAIIGGVTDQGVLAVDRSDTVTLDGAIIGAGSFVQQGTGTTILTANNTYAGGTVISAGTLQLGNGGTGGGVTGDILDNGTLVVDRTDLAPLIGTLSGTGNLVQAGSGTTVLSGTNTYGGTTQVTAGGLFVDGDQSGATGLTSVANGATLGGTGTIGGSVTIASGGTLAPGDVTEDPGVLTINHDLTLSPGALLAYSFGQANVAGGPLNDLTNVGGNLTLAGTINVTLAPGGTFAPGIYRIFNYAGTLTDNGLTIGAIPATTFFVQTSIANQVNLINATGLTLNFWDGAAGPKNDGTINGGNGVWQSSAGNNNWTNPQGTLNAPFADASFAIFEGAPGTVTVDDSLGNVTVSGMQFATSGYLVEGGAITLVGSTDDPGAAIVRTGDGTDDGIGSVTTIASVLQGSVALDKTDVGTLVLTGINTYTGGTIIEDGTVQIASDANLGAATGTLSLDGGTLHTTADIVSARATTLGTDGGTFETDAGTVLTLNGAVSGDGMLTKTAAGTLLLTADNTYLGSTVIDAGTLQLGNGGTSGSIVGPVTDNGTLVFDRSDTVTFDGAISGTGAVVQTGGGTVVLSADSTYTGGTTIAAGTLQLGNGGTTGSITGNVTNDGTLVFDRSDTVAFGGIISGSGAVVQAGSGATVLTADNSYAGGTTISAGTLQLGDGGTAGSIEGAVTDNGALVFDRSDTVTFAGTITGSGTVTQTGTGAVVLTGDNGYAGVTTVASGALYVNGNQAAAIGPTGVASGATLGGTGTIGGDVVIASGGTLAPGDNSTVPGTLTINGTLALDGGSLLAYRFGQPNTEGGPFNDLTNVGGNLTLAGTINVSLAPGGSFDPGIYRIINYAGALTNHGLTIGAIPGPGFNVQTAINHQVNLVNTLGVALTFWDGDAGGKFNGTIEGGNGVWLTDQGDSWTNVAGALNAPWLNGDFAVFAGTPGTVTVDNGSGQVQASGMQFASDGYLLQGGTIALVGAVATPTVSVIRVGDGSSDGAAMTATIDAVLSGATTIEKTDLGTLVLGGANTYTGGTAIDGGTLEISGDANLGAASGALGLDGGALATTASFTITRATTLGPGGGTFEPAAGTQLTLATAIGGTGALTMDGSGSLVLTGANGYSGGTIVTAGTLQLGDGGTAGSIQGDVVDNATLAFNRSDTVTFGGIISGAGTVVQAGSGTTVLTADDSYTGGTLVSAGTLAVGDAAHAGAVLSGGGTVTVASGATFGGYGSVAGSVDNGGTLAVADAVGAFAGQGQGSFTIGGTLVNAGTVQLGGAAVGNRLVVGNYMGTGPQSALSLHGLAAMAAGQQATIAMNAVLGGDGSPADQLVINGGTAGGHSLLAVTNLGGQGATTPGNGIQLVDAAGGATTATDAFALGDRLVAGPYQYTLFRGARDGSAPDSWYLRSEQTLPPTTTPPPSPPAAPSPAEPNYRSEVSLYTALPAMALNYGVALVGSLHERVGEEALLHGGNGEPGGAWARIIGQDGKWTAASGGIYRNGPTFENDIYGMQAGVDLYRSDEDGQRDFAGLIASFGHGGGEVTHYDQTSAGNTHFNADSLGAYWTHFGPDGWYVDGVVQGTWFDANAHSPYLASPTLTHGAGFLVSGEGGYPIQLDGGWSLEPQVQLIYQTVRFDGTADAAAEVRFPSADALTARFGGRLARTWALDDGENPRRLTGWALANVWNEFDANPVTEVSSAAGFVPFHADLRSTWGEFGGGLNAEVTQTLSVYATVAYQKGLDRGLASFDGTVGVRMNW